MKYIVGFTVIVILIYVFNQLSDLYKDIVGNIAIGWIVMSVVRKLN